MKTECCGNPLRGCVVCPSEIQGGVGVKTSQLTGVALDWAVAKCVGKVHCDELLNGTIMYGWWISGLFTDPNYWIRNNEYNPSTSWFSGGPIIERANITIIRANDDYEVDVEGFCTDKRIPQWFAECGKWVGHNISTSYEGEHMEPTFMIGEGDGYYGPTPLIAAMRCFVAFKLGDEVDIPKELL